MKTFLSKILRDSSNKNEERPISFKPKLTHVSSYQMVQNRALIGWIASRLAVALEFDEAEREALFFMAFTTETLEEIESKSVRELMQVAESAVEWIHANSVIEEELKTIEPTITSKDILSRVLNDVQSDVNGLDLTPDKSNRNWEVYRDVIYAATHGRFLLIHKNEMDRYKNGELLCEVEVRDRKDISTARNLAKESFAAIGLKTSKITSYNLIISEAVTNILKHATSGKMMVYKELDGIYVVVEDKGPGFPLKILPKTTLMAGFSTKQSLGQGFTLMMKMANQVVLETSSTGSTLILVLDGGKEDKGNDS